MEKYKLSNDLQGSPIRLYNKCFVKDYDTLSAFYGFFPTIITS